MDRKSNKVKVYLPLFLSLAIAGGILIGKLLPGNNDMPSVSVRPNVDKISSIVDYIESEYVDEVDRAELEDVAIPAMLEKLDPHSIYIPAKDLQRVNEPLQGNFDGIGVTFNMLTDTILVISVIPGGPSDKAGLIAGDKIIMVDDSLVAGKGIPDDNIVGMLKGPKGTVVKVDVLRKGFDDLISYDITRGEIPIYSVDVGYMMDENTGYIKITRFAQTTFQEFMQHLEELKEKGMTQLILDLRGNTGGYMVGATRIADQFLDENKLILFTRGRAHPREEIRATAGGAFLEGNLLILIDEGSASASEILAGAVQDNDRGIIIGRRSFGKGLIQEPVMMKDGSAIRLTIARYYTPSGRSIQRPYDEGIEEYYRDFHLRFMRGELQQADSIHFADSLAFKTPAGRTVYGGGGIMPDVFVPIDTSGLSRYFLEVRRKTLIYRFSMMYTEQNREEMSAFTEPAVLASYLLKQNLLNRFLEYAREEGVAPDPAGLKESGELIDIQLRAYIARNMLDNPGFYPIWQELDETLQKAYQFLQEEKYTKLLTGPVEEK